ncbi:MAG: ADP-ribosylation factor-like protein [Planctomycetota bacterium]|nr:ADP-ribosylation factor-like protein [Planctomycetota bacterium]
MMQKKQDDPRVRNIDSLEQVDAFIRFAKSKDQKKALVEKIVIGPSPGSDVEQQWNQKSLAALSEVDWSTFPKLTHLYLWSLGELTALKPLPERLQCLDVRGCAKLEGLPALPASIETLVTDKCAALSSVSMIKGRLRNLTDVSMQRCTSLEPATASTLISQSPNLRKIDFSGSPVKAKLEVWPEGIESVIFNDCKTLEELPRGPWPHRLRRLELRGTSITRIEPLSPTLDYVNLSNLKKGLGATLLWPADSKQARPRTLLLYRSGLLVPPTFAQGADHEENVAAAVRGYFDDVDLVGSGVSRRCKVLFLGDGGAGKTTLSLALAGKPAKHSLGTTHAIRFDQMKRGSIHWHLWDFGGQAIYHNAHRLFMQSGAVFLVLWNPRRQQPAAEPGAYLDTPRPLPYWIEMIRMGCPGARIAVVCNVMRTDSEDTSNGAGPGIDAADRQRYQQTYEAAVEGLSEKPPLLICDAEDRSMVEAEVLPWLDETLTAVVQAQGSVVPVHWEISEEIVVEWLRTAEKAEAAGKADPRPTLSVEEFREELRTTIDGKLEKEGASRWPKLHGNWRQGALLTPDRIERVLGFLTDSGLLFWNKEHLHDVVIVGQKWALDGVYAVLERRTDTEARRKVYRRLSEDPTFAFRELGPLVWDAQGFTPSQQRLLLQFMEQMKLCFPLRSDEDAWSGEGRFVSVQHLRPDAQELLADNFAMEFNARNPVVVKSAVATLHQTQWEQALTWLGKTYGGDAQYARDAFLLDRNDDGQTVLVTCAIAPSGIGGLITVTVASQSGDRQKDRETAEKVLKAVCIESRPETTGKQRRDNRADDAHAGSVETIRHVFISYSWNPPARDSSSLFEGADLVPPEYEQPIIDLCTALKAKLGDSTLLWDRDYIGPRTRISKFIRRAKEGSLFVVCHSERYWQRPYCMYELVRAYEECGRRAGWSFESHFVFVGFRDCLCLDDEDYMQQHVKAWKNRKPQVSAAFKSGLNMTKDELVRRVTLLLEYDLGKITDVVGTIAPGGRKLDNRFGEKIAPGNIDNIANWIAERFKQNLPPGDQASDDDG